MGWNLREKAKCQTQIEECPTPHHHLIMNIIVWNSRGVLKPNFQNHVQELTRLHDPTIFVVMETRFSGERAKEITNRLLFDGAIHANIIWYAGGLWVLWNFEKAEVAQLVNIEQEIHVSVKVCSSNLT